MDDMRMIVLVWAGVFGAILSATAADFGNSTGNLYKTIISTNTGQYAAVDTNREIVTLYDKTDHVIWTTNIILGLKSTLIMGERKIHGLEIYKGELWAHVGRGYGVIDIKTGDLEGLNQD